MLVEVREQQPAVIVAEEHADGVVGDDDDDDGDGPEDINRVAGSGKLDPSKEEGERGVDRLAGAATHLWNRRTVNPVIISTNYLMPSITPSLHHLLAA